MKTCPTNHFQYYIFTVQTTVTKHLDENGPFQGHQQQHCDDVKRHEGNQFSGGTVSYYIVGSTDKNLTNENGASMSD
jgi:hypothetical protein